MDQLFDMSRKRLTRAVLLALSATVLQDVGHGTMAEQTPRRSMRKSQPASPAHAAPDVTSTILAPKAPMIVDDETLPKPFDLPVAPRTRMRACGEKWQTIKMSGDVADQTWRDFATKCLAEPDVQKKSAP